MGRLKTLPLRLATAAPGRALPPATWRAGKTTAERGYGGRWQREREDYLRLHPLCWMCEAEVPRRVTPATVVDHRVPHRGDPVLFWDRSNWGSLCKPHHDGAKQRLDREAG